MSTDCHTATAVYSPPRGLLRVGLLALIALLTFGGWLAIGCMPDGAGSGESRSRSDLQTAQAISAIGDRLDALAALRMDRLQPHDQAEVGEGRGATVSLSVVQEYESRITRLEANAVTPASLQALTLSDATQAAEIQQLLTRVEALVTLGDQVSRLAVQVERSQTASAQNASALAAQVAAFDELQISTLQQLTAVLKAFETGIPVLRVPGGSGEDGQGGAPVGPVLPPVVVDDEEAQEMISQLQADLVAAGARLEAQHSAVRDLRNTRRRLGDELQDMTIERNRLRGLLETLGVDPDNPDATEAPTPADGGDADAPVGAAHTGRLIDVDARPGSEVIAIAVFTSNPPREEGAYNVFNAAGEKIADFVVVRDATPRNADEGVVWLGGRIVPLLADTIPAVDDRISNLPGLPPLRSDSGN